MEYKPCLNSVLLLCGHYGADESQSIYFSLFWAKIFVSSKLPACCVLRLSHLTTVNQ